MSKNTGKIVQVIGPVVDVAFENGDLPQLLTAIEIPLKDSESLVVEVAQHIGDERVRCIAMGGTDGLVRGMEAIDTGSAIRVPVGKEILGRMFNVDVKLMVWDLLERRTHCRSTDRHRALRSSRHPQKCWKQELRSLTCYAHIPRVVRLVCLAVRE